MQVIAWSGAGLDVYPGFLSNGSRAYMTGVPDEVPETITPEVPTLFGRQLAADNTSMVTNASWVPQVCSTPLLAYVFCLPVLRRNAYGFLVLPPLLLLGVLFGLFAACRSF